MSSNTTYNQNPVDSSEFRRIRLLKQLRIGLLTLLLIVFVQDTHKKYDRLWVGKKQFRLNPQKFTGFQSIPSLQLAQTSSGHYTFPSASSFRSEPETPEGAQVGINDLKTFGSDSENAIAEINEIEPYKAEITPRVIDELEPDFDYIPEYSPDELIADIDHNTNHKYFITVYGEQFIYHSMSLTGTAGLEFYEQSAQGDHVSTHEIAPSSTVIHDMRSAGVMAGRKIGKRFDLSGGVEIAELAGRQTYFYDVEKEVTTTVTRNVPIPGPFGSEPQYETVVEERVETVIVQDTLTSNFSRRMIHLPMQLRGHLQLNEKWSVYAAVRAALHLQTNSSTRYESSDITLDNKNQESRVFSPQYYSLGLGTGVAFKPIEKIEITAEPSFVRTNNIRSEAHIFSGSSRAYGLRLSAGYYF